MKNFKGMQTYLRVNYNLTSEILFNKHAVLTLEPAEDKYAYYNAYLLANFGIELTNPKAVNKEVVKKLSDHMQLSVPRSFYNNPQDLNYFSSDELLLEQLVSYFLFECVDNTTTRVELFKKSLPQYVEGDEIKTRQFTVVNEEEAAKIIEEYFNNILADKRPFSNFNREVVNTFFDVLYDGQYIACRDNALELLSKNMNIIKFVDKKDVVKLSVRTMGENKKFSIADDKKALWRYYVENCMDCALSTKQAKYFNQLCKKVGVKAVSDNSKSPYKAAKAEFFKGNYVEAAKILSKSGSLLERNLKVLLSRANPVEVVDIVNLLDDSNPIVLWQLGSSLSGENDGEARTFRFIKNNCVVSHTETDDEVKWRKSRLSEGTKKYLKEVILEKIKKHYNNASLGKKIFCDPEFEKVAVPMNTAANGNGLDVLPTGSRIPIRGNSIRTFVTWKDAFDIDSSLILIDGEGRYHEMGFWNYSDKEFGGDVLCSGDIRTKDGTEYYDINVDKLISLGYKKIIQIFNGFQDRLDKGEIYCGYQDKTNLNTKAWDPKNVEFKIHVKSDSRSFIGFALDLETKEVVVLNLNNDSESRVMNPSDKNIIERYLKAEYNELNMKSIIDGLNDEFVETPEDAEIIFSSTYQAQEGQEVIRPWDVEKLVRLVSQ